MKTLDLKNPFGAPIYHEETLFSTMDAARDLAARGEPHGTVICADFQESGRGRQNRSWLTDRGKNLLFTIMFRYEDYSAIPEALTLKAGLAVSLAIEELLPGLAGKAMVKWPNDVMIDGRKTAGILTEADGKNVFVGAGVNVAQSEFNTELRSKAGSLIQACPDLPPNARFILLERLLSRLHGEIEKENDPWRDRLLARLYKKGETVTFAEGSAESPMIITGTISGIGPEGELIIVPEGEEKERGFVNGELRVY